MKLTRAGIAKVKRGRRTKLTLYITARDAAGNVRTVGRSLTLTR